ncbi:DNA ligase [Cronobacter phage Dev-CD-23823]|uniref:DNA ligase n=1 Tax=Cronobacter phage Dev-CD-23823 TaxID=1712539 RepID=A0A0K8IXB0_9CAUD|nr:DNA ligase [Cronobacter phage Dev-CD-23823]CUH74594.1 DNA ligase [Cronobacter phage Dev-CD-23823]
MAKLTVMKGTKYDRKRLLQWLEEDGAVVVQTKRDEIRCKVNIDDDNVVTYTSAQGKPLYNLSCFDAMWVHVATSSGIYEFDTGVCVNESFDLTKRTVRASKKQYDLTGNSIHTIEDKKKGYYFSGTLEARFYLYDLPTAKAPYENRRIVMCELASLFPELYVPETYIATSEYDVDEYYRHMVEAGHEGTMIKRVDYDYVYGRTVCWMKMKPEEERDGEVIGYVEGQGKYEGLIGSVKVRFVDGSTTAISGMSDGLRADISERREEYIGRIVEVRFMQRDSDGGYRHPRFYRWHPDKDTLEGSE